MFLMSSLGERVLVPEHDAVTPEEPLVLRVSMFTKQDAPFGSDDPDLRYDFDLSKSKIRL